LFDSLTTTKGEKMSSIEIGYVAMETHETDDFAVREVAFCPEGNPYYGEKVETFDSYQKADWRRIELNADPEFIKKCEEGIDATHEIFVPESFREQHQSKIKAVLKLKSEIHAMVDYIPF
jgi:hypothetical protein